MCFPGNSGTIPYVSDTPDRTNSDELVERIGSRESVVVERDPPSEPFHFGRRLAEIVERFDVNRPLYFGGASAPLLAPESLEELCSDLIASQNRVFANNLASAASAWTTGTTLDVNGGQHLEGDMWVIGREP